MSSSTHPHRLQRRDALALAGVWSTALTLGALAAGVRVHRVGGVRRHIAWPWVHWCVFDDRCRAGGARRVYLHLAGVYIELPGDDVEAIEVIRQSNVSD